jgi:hypothetical protein
MLLIGLRKFKFVHNIFFDAYFGGDIQVSGLI